MAGAGATIDAYDLSHQTNALVIGQSAADPIDQYGNDNAILRLPYYDMFVQYTTAVVNPSRTVLGVPNIVVAPTLHDLLTGAAPCSSPR